MSGERKTEKVDSASDLKVDVLEHGMGPDGSRTSTNRRLFMQLQVFIGAIEPKALGAALTDFGVQAVIYLDAANPRSIGVLTMSENPKDFVSVVRPCFNEEPFASLSLRTEFTMFGRSYASGYESQLEDWLTSRPRRTVLNPEWPWAVWYPLRRTGSFNSLPTKEQTSILREHGGIGRLYGEQDLAHDVRLACHGIDENDNEFVIGIIGKELHPLSHLVQTMRKTRQTSEFIEHMGPFFVGYAVWRSPVS